ncbi:MAG: DegT/DnrJ/EryC1/StrS family aminotransferase, partial [Acidobacteriota bacterium]
EMEAAIGIAQLEDRDALCARRRTIAAALDDGLAQLAGEHLRLPATRAGAEHAYMFYAITITDDRVARADLIQYLEERSIETHYVLPLINQPVYRQRFGNLDSEYPVAAHLNERAFYIGCHPDMTDDDVSYVVDSFRTYFADRV